jgi:hypothetical protein
MGRRGPAPEYAKRERLGRLLADGVSLSEAARQVGVNRKTAKRWRNGRSIRYPDGRVLKLPPVITTTMPKSYSTRYLSEDERIRLADLKRTNECVNSTWLHRPCPFQDGQARPDRRPTRHQGVLLRRPLAVATPHEREHQRSCSATTSPRGATSASTALSVSTRLGSTGTGPVISTVRSLGLSELVDTIGAMPGNTPENGDVYRVYRNVTTDPAKVGKPRRPIACVAAQKADPYAWRVWLGPPQMGDRRTGTCSAPTKTPLGSTKMATGRRAGFTTSSRRRRVGSPAPIWGT